MRYIVEKGWLFETWYVYDKQWMTYVGMYFHSEGACQARCDELNEGAM